MLPLVSTLTLVASLATATVDSAELRREDLMSALRGGGYTIILRHARTDRTVMEDPSYIPTERFKQRNLNDVGVADARLMGVVFKKYGITFSEIVSSPLFRTKETAEYAAGTPTTTIALRSFPSTAEQAALVTAAPRAGTNRLLVTHHFVIETHVPGIRPGEIGESEAVVVRLNSAGKVEIAGRITLADWTTLGAAATADAPAPVPAAAPAAHGSSGVALPATPLGRLAEAYLRAFNTGDAVQMAAFIDKSLAIDANRPTADRVQSFGKLFEDLGPLMFAGTEPSEGGSLIVQAHAKTGMVRVTFKPSSDQAGRLASVSFMFGQAGGHP